jgi:hypothetical protein
MLWDSMSGRCTGGLKVPQHTLMLALDGGVWLASCSGSFILSPYRMGGWVCPTDSMDSLAKVNILVPICNQTQGVGNCPAHFNVC